MYLCICCIYICMYMMWMWCPLCILLNIIVNVIPFLFYQLGGLHRASYICCRACLNYHLYDRHSTFYLIHIAACGNITWLMLTYVFLSSCHVRVAVCNSQIYKLYHDIQWCSPFCIISVRGKIDNSLSLTRTMKKQSWTANLAPIPYIHVWRAMYLKHERVSMKMMCRKMH